jgi:hypothetical protein
MANPYPMQPMGQPMMQQQPPAPMGGMPQMGAPPAVKRGTSKAVPVVVSAGLAIGVFCGLLFGLGVDKDEAKADPAPTKVTASTPKKTEGDVAPAFAPEKKDVKVPSLAPQVVDKDGKTKDAPKEDKKEAGSGSGSAKEEAKPTKVVGKLTIEVMPEGAAKAAKVSIDGTDIEGLTWELDMTDLVKGKKPEEVKKEVKIVVKSSGYKDSNPTPVAVVATADTKVKIEMIKRYTGGGTGNLPRVQQPVVPNNGGGNTKPPPPKCKKPPCGLIDI